MSTEQKTTTYPHQDLIAKNKIVLTELTPKTQDAIQKFNAEKDETKKEALDEKIFGDVEDYLEAKANKEKSEKKKDRYAEAKKQTSAAPAASNEPKKKSGFVGRRFGR